MKNKFFIFAIIILLTATTITIVSCKKDKPTEDATKNVNLAENNNVDNMDAYLLSFKEKLQNATKGGETISIEQAQRDLGNLLNFDFGDANYATNVYQHDTLYSQLAVQDGQISYYDLAIAYEKTVSNIQQSYQSNTLPEKSIYLIQCNFKETNEKTADDYIEVETIVTTRGFSDNSNILSFPGDWRANDFGGTCSGSMIGIYGAPQVLKAMLNGDLGEIACLNGCRVYFTDESNHYIDYHAPNMTDNLSPCGYKLYVSDEYDQSTVCIYEEELNYYYDQARFLPLVNNNFFPPIPSNHSLIGYSIRLRDSDINNSIVTLPWYWELIVTYAKPHCTCSPIIDD